MCFIQKGKILEIRGENVLVLVNNKKKEVKVEEKVRVGDEIYVFQSLGFKRDLNSL